MLQITAGHSHLFFHFSDLCKLQGSDLFSKDADRVVLGTTVILSYGLNNLHQHPERAAKEAEDLIESIYWDNITSKVNVGIMELPPQKDYKRDKCAKAINEALHNRCAGTDIRIIGAELTHKDVDKDSEQLNNRGKAKVAESIRNFVTIPLLV